MTTDRTPSTTTARETTVPENQPTSETPPVAKYRLTITITGNSHDEIVGELLSMTRGGYLLDSDYYKRDEWRVWGGRRTSVMEHTNPDQTPEAYDEHLRSWHEAQIAARRERESR